MKRKLIAAAASMLLAASAWSQPYGMGPGMMGGYGPGGYGPGGYGMGPGMMGGYGPGGYGMGPGMMGGYGGGYGMGPGTMGGYGGGYGIPDLTSEQRAKIAQIQDEFGRRQWELMDRMHQQWGTGDVYRDGVLDEKAARKAYEVMAEARKQMFENSLEAQKRIDAALTKQQREQMRRGWGGR